MKRFLVKRIKRIVCPVLLILLLLSILCMTARAASGTIYTCKMTPCYAHPVTGEIEDAGGSSSTATGQGMVEGALGNNGVLEVTDSGEYYLTFRLGLMEYTSGHEFSVQEVNASGWSGVQAQVMGSGSDDSGKTSDMRVQVPSESSIIRCSMYVEPMGRNVIFYFYPSDYVEGNTTDIKTEMVTETSAGNSSGEESSQADTPNTAKQSGGQDGGKEETSEKNAAETDKEGENTAANAAVSAGNAASDGDSSLNEAQGLSLSTAPEAGELEQSEASGNVLTWILILIAALTCSGLILLLTGAYLVYFCRKNWRRWGGDADREEEDGGGENDVFFGEGFGLPDDRDRSVWDSEGVERETDEWDYDPVKEIGGGNCSGAEEIPEERTGNSSSGERNPGSLEEKKKDEEIPWEFEEVSDVDYLEETVKKRERGKKK